MSIKYASIATLEALITKIKDQFKTKADAIDIPINISELYNDSKYQSEQEVLDKINNAIADITGFSYEVVQELPAVQDAKAGVIYLVGHPHATSDAYDEYILVNATAFEKIGNTDIDLSQYATKEELNTKQDKLIVYPEDGETQNLRSIVNKSILGVGNLDITFGDITGDPAENENLVSRYTYTPGEGISISNNVISSTVKGSWGEITGDIINQIDLVTQLNNKLNISDYNTNLSSYTNDVGYVVSTTLDDYAKKLDLQTLANKEDVEDRFALYRTATQQNEIDSTKANKNDVYIKDEVYTKAETDQAITNKGYITSTAVDNKLTNYVTNSNLNNTLNNYITNTTLEGKGYITSSALDGYTTESFVEGKGYQTSTQVTSAIDTKLQSYSTTETINSQLANKQDKLTAGTGISISNNTISTTLTVPTKVSDLENDNQYQTQSQVQSAITTGLSGYATEAFVTGKNYTTMAAVEEKGYQNASQVSSAIASAVSDITSFEYQVVSELPDSGSKGIIYLLSHSHGEQDVYDEYIWIPNETSGSFEKIGNTDIDLSGYALASDLDTLENNVLLKSAINDTAEVSNNTLWSSNKVNTEIQAIKQDIASISIDGGEI